MTRGEGGQNRLYSRPTRGIVRAARPRPLPGERPRVIRPLLLLAAFLAPALAPAADRDPARVEADRVTARAAARATEPGGAVDLIRLAELADWLPSGEVPARLRAAATDRRRLPLVRAVAWWLLREDALARLDAATAAEAARALGLLDGFAIRVGGAPHPTAALDAADYQPWPRGAGAGELWLESFLRPDREVTATAVSRLVSPQGGPAVLRLGYDDAATVWLNGDEVFAADATHPAWLDQVAIPVVLRPGDNRLVVEIRQRHGAWRLIARVTDPAGEPLPVESHPDPWGEAPAPAEGERPEAVEHLWTALYAAAEADPPVAADLRDMADYARVTGLPDADQALPRVAIEGAWITEPSPRTLRAWLRILPEGEQARVESAHAPKRPIEEADHWADLERATAAAWTHYHARRHGEARRAVEAILANTPGHLPAIRLAAVIHEDLGLSHTGAALLARARARWPDRPGLIRAHLAALQTGGRVIEAITLLEAWAEAGGGPDAHYQLATLLAARGETARAVALLDAVTAARPELWTYGVEAAEILLVAGEADEARRRLGAILDARPGDASIAERLARLLVEQGDPDAALAIVDRALLIDPGSGLDAMRARLDARPPRERLGPSIDVLLDVPPAPNAPAQVLYHHGRAEVALDGRATRRLRRVVRVLTEEGARRYGTVELAYVPSTQQIELEEARLLRPGEAPASPRRTDRDLSDPAWRLYYDLRAEVLDFPRVQPGDVIEVAWRLVDTDPDPAFPGYYGELAWLQESIPRAHTVVEIQGPLAPALAVALVPRGLAVEQDGLRFTAHDVPAVPLEAAMPGPSSLRAHVHISSVADWTTVDRRYRALLDARDRPTDALAARARAWAGDARTPEEILTRLHAAVADRVRYVGLEFGVHSFKPELPAVTLARGYGDCKDKATLLIALAAALGVDAKLVLVRTRPSGAIEPQPASLAIFDHAIVYVPALDRFLDPTIDRNDPWVLPPGDQGALGFVIGHDAKAPVIIPPEPAAANRDTWTLDLTLTADGRATGRARWTTRGQPATAARRALDGAVDPAAPAERALAERYPGARLTAPKTTGIAPAYDPVTVDAAVTLPPLHASARGVDLPIGGAPWRLVERFAQTATRETALLVPWRETRRVEATITLPPGWRPHQLPPPTVIESPFGRLDTRAAVDGARVTLSAELRLDAFRVEPADYPAFRAWLAAVEDALHAPVEVGP